MGAFGVLLGTLHYMGLYIQLSATTEQVGHTEVENHISGNVLGMYPSNNEHTENIEDCDYKIPCFGRAASYQSRRAMFTEVPRDMTAQRGQDVEMACSFRGAGTPSYCLEIQWWYIRNDRDWTENQPWITNEMDAEEDMPKDATKISVVKVAGSNISHKLRLSDVKLSDEGIYECRVFDFSDGAGARHHRARAYLQVVPEGQASNGNRDVQAFYHSDRGDPDVLADSTKQRVSRVGPGNRGDLRDMKGHGYHQNRAHHQERGKHPLSPAQHDHSQQNKAGSEPRKVLGNHSPKDCSTEPSCVL